MVLVRRLKKPRAHRSTAAQVPAPSPVSFADQTARSKCSSAREPSPCKSDRVGMLRLYNTLTRQEEPFEPLRDGIVRMYACGPTVYARAHIGNFRYFV